MKLKLLTSDARIPTYGTDGAACFDLYGCTAATIPPARRVQVDLGISVEVPEHHVMLIFSRSGQGVKGVRLSNCVGVIDSDYRGELRAMVANDSTVPVHIAIGDRVAQAMVLPVSRVTFDLVDELSETVRGIGGHGSTGR